MLPRPPLLVAGEWITVTATETSPTSWLPVLNPFTGAPIAEVPLGTAATIESALAAAAERAFPITRVRPRFERAQILTAVAAGLQRRSAEFIDTIVAEAGKPITLAEAEVTRAIMTFTTAAEEARREPGELLSLDAFAAGAHHTGLVRRFPLGTVAAICPFNFPLNLVAHKVAPALATGNCVIVKPALKTPLTALLLAEVLVAAGIVPGEVSVLTCANEDVARLITDPRIHLLSFTGSDAVGWRLKEQCPRKRVTLELGGNAAVIVHQDADLAAALPAIATGAFAYAGQSCISVQRILVHAPLYAEFRERFCAHVARHIVTGDPREHATVVGPLINAEALARIRQRLASAVAAGATILHGGEAHGACLEPTILENVPLEAELCTEEAFAPIVTLHSYQDFEDALAQANASRFGLQAGVFTQDLDRAWHAFDRLQVGGVLINQVPTWRVENMPYGGVKDSGFGREGVRYAMEEMTEPKTLLIQHRA